MGNIRAAPQDALGPGALHPAAGAASSLSEAHSLAVGRPGEAHGAQAPGFQRTSGNLKGLAATAPTLVETPTVQVGHPSRRAISPRAATVLVPESAGTALRLHDLGAGGRTGARPLGLGARVRAPLGAIGVGVAGAAVHFLLSRVAERVEAELMRGRMEEALRKSPLVLAHLPELAQLILEDPSQPVVMSLRWKLSVFSLAEAEASGSLRVPYHTAVALEAVRFDRVAVSLEPECDGVYCTSGFNRSGLTGGLPGDREDWHRVLDSIPLSIADCAALLDLGTK